METARISTWQFFILTLVFLLGTSFLFFIGGLISIAKQDAWIPPLWAGIASVPLSLLWVKLMSYYPGSTLIQICIQVAGKGLGRLIALLYIGYFIHLSSLVTRNLGDFMKINLMPRTPISVFHVMFLIVVCYAVIKGIETIARSAEFLFPLVTVTFIAIFCIALYEWDWERFQGVFRMNIWATMKETRSIFSFPFMEAFLLAMLFPYVNSRNKIKGTFILANVVAALLLSVGVFFTIGVLSITQASHETYSMFVIVQEIHIGNFFEHLESTIALILLIIVFIKLSITYYCAVSGLCQLFQVKNRSWIAISLVLLVSGLSLAFDNILENIVFNREYYFQYMLPFAVLFPLLFLFVTWMKKGKAKRKAVSPQS
ncbi:endospore germination permease [Thermoactinomyces sp. DSM 45892]|uniref:GerAB/ArcD/ProY family transporter n=1 Tax=Thermoactinomyces sp. DSM 45892 TaxID=1882753 RepID=UPI000895B404|nr:endospore germination permease [Thermoactinomyces sp. DSM 45892]SDZ23184.1 spore germination protein KB [Thermoactinomyces sp. DSM 45892]